MAAREAAEVAEAVQESNPNDFSNEHGYSLEGLNNMAGGSSTAMALHESLPADAYPPDSQVQKKARKGKKKKKRDAGVNDNAQEDASSLVAN